MEYQIDKSIGIILVEESIKSLIGKSVPLMSLNVCKEIKTVSFTTYSNYAPDVNELLEDDKYRFVVEQSYDDTDDAEREEGLCYYKVKLRYVLK
jgi:hypothetical protein